MTSSSSYKSLPDAKLNRELTDFIITIFGRALGNIAIMMPIMNVRIARTIHTKTMKVNLIKTQLLQLYLPGDMKMLSISTTYGPQEQYSPTCLPISFAPSAKPKIKNILQ